jgi:UDP-N-acetylglucosamine 2-epimerase (non-hydrolysing)
VSAAAAGQTPAVVHVVGVRPNYVKVSAVLRAAERQGGLKNLLVDTGQHYDASLRGDLYRDLGLREPDLYLGIGSGTHSQQTAAIMVAFEAALGRLCPDAVVVFGDVNSTLACALVASKMGVPLAHVEAGLRCFDRSVPEEINRVVVDGLADLLFAPSPDAVDNLLREGAPPDRVHLVGNVMVDALRQALPQALRQGTCERLGLPPGAYALLTLHRPCNVDQDGPLLRILEAIAVLQQELPILFPMHPRTAARMEVSGLGARLRSLPGVRVVPPLGYLDFLCLQARARLILTDSGGVQEESSVLGVPCVTLLERTERPVTVSLGTNHLAGAAPEQILGASRLALGRERRPIVLDGWDGAAGPRVVDHLVRWLTAGEARRVPGR